MKQGSWVGIILLLLLTIILLMIAGFSKADDSPRAPQIMLFKPYKLVPDTSLATGAWSGSLVCPGAPGPSVAFSEQDFRLLMAEHQKLPECNSARSSAVLASAQCQNETFMDKLVDSTLKVLAGAALGVAVDRLFLK